MSLHYRKYYQQHNWSDEHSHVDANEIQQKIPNSFLHFLNTVKKNLTPQGLILFWLCITEETNVHTFQNYLEESDDPDGMQ